MRVLAIDPGYDRCGIAVLEKQNGKEVLVYSDCIQTSSKQPLPARFKCVGDEIIHIINIYNPTIVAVERLYFNTNQKTAIAVAGIRGILLFLAEQNKLSVVEYSPGEIKLAVTSYGGASKDQIISMIPRLINIKKEIQHDDEYDAIAVGLTCLAKTKQSEVGI